MNKPAILAMMVALIVATDYAMFALPNVKLMDMLVFLTGFWLGPLYGAAAGGMSWAVYGTVNPLGFNLVTFATVVPMEMLYGVIGGVLASRIPRSLSAMAWAFGFVGLFATVAYDLVTNAVTGILFYSGMTLGSLHLPNWAEGIVVGLVPFSLTHVISNLVQFAVLAPVLVVECDRVYFRGVSKLA